MKKFALAAVCTIAAIGFVIADEFPATITKIDGSKVTYKKGKKGEDPVVATAETTPDVKVMKGAKDPDTKMVKAGEAIDKGLKNEMFSNIDDKGIKGQITTNDKGKITQILILKGKKGG
jgi:hypothetical protein